MGVVEPSSVIAHSTAVTITTPGISSFAGPWRSYCRPTGGPSSPINNPPGSNNRPDWNALTPRTFCR